MKASILLLLLLLLYPSPVLSQEAKPANQTKEQIKLAKQSAKETEKRRKQEEKERLKRPAAIQIAGPSDEIMARIVQHMNSRNYQIAEEGKYRIVFTQEVTGFRGALLGGLAGAQGTPLRSVAFTVSQFGESSTVTVDLSVQIRKAFGRVDRVDMNKNKEWRSDVQSLLETIKYLVEARR